MPETREQAVARQAGLRAAARRRQVTVQLQIMARTCEYGASQLANGTSPAEARATALFVASELAGMAAALRKAVRPSRAERQRLAVELTGARGLSVPAAARCLGVSERTVWRDLGR